MTEDNNNNNQDIKGREVNVSSFDNSNVQNQPQNIQQNYKQKKNNGVDEDLEELGTSIVQGLGVPRPIAKAAVKTNGGPLNPFNLPGNKIIANKTRSALGDIKGKLGGNPGVDNNVKKGLINGIRGGKSFNRPNAHIVKPNQGGADSTGRQKYEQMQNKVNRASDSSLPNNNSLEKKSGLPEKEGLQKKEDGNSGNSGGPLGKLGGLSNLKNKLGGGLGGAKANAKDIAKTFIKNKIKHLFIVGLPWTVIIPLILIVIILLFAFFAAYLGGQDDSTSIISSSSGSSSSKSSSSCGGISLVSTSLSRDDYISKLKEYSKNNSNAKIFADNAGNIYDISKKNDFNPELVPIRAAIEGYSPGGNTYNYYGIGCTNTGGGGDCTSYSSFDAGVLGYIKTVKSYGVDDLLKVYSEKHYAFIGTYWYNPGGSGTGGCYYFPYIKKYMSSSRSSQVNGYCDKNKTCTGSSCKKTNDEDQLAYSKFQLEKTSQYRSSIFGIETNYNCDDESTDTTKSPKNSNGVSGLDVAEYAVKKFDSFGYDQGRRMSDSYVDCSSMVWRAYHDKAGLMMGGSENRASVVSEIYDWCKSNKKLVNGNDMKPGDLAIYGNLGHAEMYYKDGKVFGAHGNQGNYANHDKQVSLETFNKKSFSYFCRPFK